VRTYYSDEKWAVLVQSHLKTKSPRRKTSRSSTRSQSPTGQHPHRDGSHRPNQEERNKNYRILSTSRTPRPQQRANPSRQSAVARPAGQRRPHHRRRLKGGQHTCKYARAQPDAHLQIPQPVAARVAIHLQEPGEQGAHLRPDHGHYPRLPQHHQPRAGRKRQIRPGQLPGAERGRADPAAHARETVQLA